MDAYPTIFELKVEVPPIRACINIIAPKSPVILEVPFIIELELPIPLILPTKVDVPFVWLDKLPIPFIAAITSEELEEALFIFPIAETIAETFPFPNIVDDSAPEADTFADMVDKPFDVPLT